MRPQLLLLNLLCTFAKVHYCGYTGRSVDINDSPGLWLADIVDFSATIEHILTNFDGKLIVLYLCDLFQTDLSTKMVALASD